MKINIISQIVFNKKLRVVESFGKCDELGVEPQGPEIAPRSQDSSVEFSSIKGIAIV